MEKHQSPKTDVGGHSGFFLSARARIPTNIAVAIFSGSLGFLGWMSGGVGSRSVAVEYQQCVQELDAQTERLAEISRRAYRYETDLLAWQEWGEKTVKALGQEERLEAQRSAPGALARGTK